MNNRQLVFLALGICLLLLVGLFFLLFERKEVPDISWDSSYNYHSKEPLDLWIFQHLVESEFTEASYHLHSLAALVEETDPDMRHLYAQIGHPLILNTAEGRAIIESAKRGNEFLFSSNMYHFFSDTLKLVTNNYFSTRQINVKLDSTEYSFPFYIHSFRQSMVQNLTYLDSTDFSGWEFDVPIFADSHAWLSEEGSLDSLGKKDEPWFLFVCFEVGEGKLCFHQAPYLFTNIASERPGYLEHFRRVFSAFDADRVHFVKPMDAITQQHDGKNPLRHLLAYPSFKWAFYLSIIGVLAYFFSEGKRKLSPIPVQSPPKNTIREFVETTTRLYLAKNRGDKLRKKIKENFFLYAEEHYHLDPNEGDFWNKLLRKSKADPRLLKQLEQVFSRKGNMGIDIFTLNKLVNRFYKNK